MRGVFTSLGMPDADATSRAALVDRVVQGFRRVTGAAPAWAWHVPGRIEVFGKHTDYAGGRSLLAAAPRGIAVAAKPNRHGLIRIADIRYETGAEINPAGDAAPLTGWASYVQVVARRFARNFPGADLGTDIAIASDLPRASGMSSSSALVVGIATALARRAGLTSRDDWQAQIRGVTDLAWYLGCVENGLDYRDLPGTDGVGTHGGSEDHTAILASRSNHVTHYGFVPVRHFGDVAMPAHWTFVLASSGVHADKAGSVRDRYNRAALTARALVECSARLNGGPAPSLAAALDGIGGPEPLERHITAQPADGFSAAELSRRLAHFVAEDARAPLAACAFAEADEDTLGRLSAESQRDADLLLGNQVHETRVLAALAREHGAFAASSFGAGFGGSVWALAHADDAERFREAWMRAYAHAVPGTTNAEFFTARPGPPLTEVPA